MFNTLPTTLSKKLEQDLLNEVSKANPKLLPVIEHTLLINPSKDHPYHNNVHTALFILSVMRSFEYVRLSKKDKHNLIIAGLYHDFDYQDATGDDLVNIRSARFGWATNSFECKELPIDPAIISSLIYSTYVKENLNPESKIYQLETIMRDSNLLCWTFDEYCEVQRLGLEQEKQKPIIVKDFIANHPIYNDYSRSLFQIAELL